ncbi:MAG: COG1361 family protein [Coriobacteriia bacterium]
MSRVRSAGRGLTVALATLLLVAMLPSAAAAERTLALSTGTFDFKVAAGQTAKGSAEVRNSGDEPLEVLVYAGQQVVEDDGAIRYIVPTPGEAQSLDNPASWIRLDLGKSVKSLGNVPYIEMAVGERARVDFEFTVPDGVPPGDYQIMLFFEMAQEKSDTDDQAQATVSGRLAARIRVRVEGEVIQRLEIKPFVVRTWVVGNAIPFTLMLQNSGNVDVITDAAITVTAGSGREVMKLPVHAGRTVYARSNDETSGVLQPPGTLLGRYTVEVDVEYPREGTDAGATERLSEERVIWAMPLWLAVAMVIIVGGFALWLSWRSAVRSAERKAEARKGQRRLDRERRQALRDAEGQSTATE